MDGGNYYTWFREEDTESRRILYRLEDLGIARLSSEKIKSSWYKHRWELTKKEKI